MSAPTEDAVARAEVAFARQCERVRGRKDGEYGPYTNADWTDVTGLHTALRAVLARQSDEAGKREAARQAWDAAAKHARVAIYRDARDKYLDAHHPLPPRECVRCALCDQSGADLSTGVHATYDECIEALGAALKSFAAGVGR